MAFHNLSAKCTVIIYANLHLRSARRASYADTSVHPCMYRSVGQKYRLEKNHFNALSVINRIKSIIYILFLSRWIKTSDIKHFIPSKRSFKATILLVPVVLTEKYNCVSSAYKLKDILCLLIMWPRRSMQKIGPRIEPRGTPQISFVNGKLSYQVPQRKERDGILTTQKPNHLYQWDYWVNWAWCYDIQNRIK